jgi:tetratricopeptide (TPR) repeat protein
MDLAPSEAHTVRRALRGLHNNLFDEPSLRITKMKYPSTPRTILLALCLVTPQIGVASDPAIPTVEVVGAGAFGPQGQAGAAGKTSAKVEALSPKKQRLLAIKLAKQDRHAEAIEAIEAVRTGKDSKIITSHDGVLFGIVYSLLGDQEGHERFSNWVLDAYAKTRKPFDAEHVAKAYLVFPGAKNNELMAKSVKLSQVGVDTIGDPSKGGWIYLSHAMAKLRLGEHEEAEKWLKMTVSNTKNPGALALAHGYSALNEAAKGNKQKAAEWLESAKGIAVGFSEDNWEPINHTKIVFGEVEAALETKVK